MQAYIFEQYTIIVWRISVLSSTDLNEEMKKYFKIILSYHSKIMPFAFQKSKGSEINFIPKFYLIL